MSLQVWLPLNGDLTQQGLSNVQVTNNGATVSNDGKIGKCYYFTPNQWIKISIPEHMTTIKNTTVAAWVKSHSNTLALGGISHDGAATLAGITLYSSGWQLSGGGNWKYISSGNIANTQVWHHVACTIGDDEIITYLDGAKVITTTLTAQAITNTILTSTDNFIEIGCDHPGGDEYFTGYVNDFRIYDHCLSAKEVKELSKGLVLHYKLDKNRQILNNCYNSPTFNTSDSNGGWSHWGRSGASGSYGQNTDKKYIYRSENSYSHWVANAASATGEYLIYQSPAFDGGYRSLQCIVKEENSSPITENICFPVWNARNGGVENDTWTSINPLGEGFYLCKCERISQNGSDDLVGIYVKPGYKVYFSECYLENNTERCSDFLFVNNNIEEDCSGYGRDGTINGSILEAEDAPRYSRCIKLDTSSSYIKLPEITYSNFGNSYTFTWWQYCTNNASNMPWGFSNGNRLNCYHTGSKLYHNTGDGASNPYQKNGTDVSSTNLLNSWHFMSLVGDGTTATLYIDGEIAGNAKTYKALTGTQIYISGWDTSANYKWTNGKLSDFRIYATALSVEDILELYHTFASIDNKGNLFCGEVVE